MLRGCLVRFMQLHEDVIAFYSIDEWCQANDRCYWLSTSTSEVIFHELCMTKYTMFFMRYIIHGK